MGCWNPQGGGAKAGAGDFSPVKPGADSPAIDYSRYSGMSAGQVYGANPNGLPANWSWDAFTAAQPAGSPDPRTQDSAGRSVDFTWNSSAPGWTNPQTGENFAPPAPQYVNTSASGSGGQQGGGYVATTSAPAIQQPVYTKPVMPPQGELVQPTYTDPVKIPQADAKAAAYRVSALGNTPGPDPAYVPPVLSRPIFAPGGKPAAAGNPVIAALMRRRRSPWDSYL